MARVTVQDCIKKIPDRFGLLVAAAERVKEIMAGDPIRIDKDNDKLPVTALREIAAGKVDPEVLREQLIRSYQKVLAPDDDDEETLFALEMEQYWTKDPGSAEMKEEILEEGLHIEDEQTLIDSQS